MKRKDINIVLACDNNFLTHFYVTVISIVNNKDINDVLNFYLFFDGDANDEKLIKIKKSFSNLGICCHIYFPIIDDVKSAKIDKNIPISAYFRLLIPKYIKHVERVIYLDCDIIVTSSLYELSNIDLLGNTIGAVKDAGVSDKVKNKIGVKSYFNSGVLLIDIKLYKENIDSCFNIISNHELITFHDQCVLNYVFRESWLELENTWNYMSNNFLQDGEGKLNFNVLHYNSIFGKPWEKGCFHPFKSHYLFVKSKTIFIHEPLKKQRLIVTLRNKFSFIDFFLKKIRGF